MWTAQGVLLTANRATETISDNNYRGKLRYSPLSYRPTAIPHTHEPNPNYALKYYHTKESRSRLILCSTNFSTLEEEATYPSA